MYLIFDTETTGLPKNWRAPLTDLKNWPRIVQIAWEMYDAERKLVDSQNLIVKPIGFSIPKEASDIHGISQERAMEEGVPIADALALFQNAIQNSQAIIAHNLDYDQTVVSAEFLRLKKAIPFTRKKLICTKEEATEFCRLPGKYGFKWPTLAELYDILFDEDFEGAHDALVDVRATSRCFFALVDGKIILLK